ncbi:MAG: histidine phosphatase family protein [Bacteroidetes bacterium]|nr:histidine phosphatase family protein [Bacteroidota bacterium]
MKCLLLVRHAKSSWDAADISDFDRTLNDRGKRDAPAMARRLVDRSITIDAFVSSPARRARKTAELFAEVMGLEKNDIQFVEELYHPAPGVFKNTIASLDDKLDTIAIFSHNPGITDFVNTLGAVRTDNMPTSGIYAVKADIQSWKEFEKAKKEFWFYDYPKAGN